MKGKPLILYITALDDSLGALLAQINDEGKEQPLYYLSRRLVGAEHRYAPMEKTCLALVFAVKKLRHYLLSHQVELISKADPLKFLLKQPALSGRLGKWALLFMEFNITYVPQKAMKGQGMADFLTAHPISEDSPLNTDLIDEETLQGREVQEASIKFWKLYFDGASRTSSPSDGSSTLKAGIGIVLVSPEGSILHTSCALEEPCTNNEVEYEALIVGLEIALDMGIRCI